MLQDFITSYAAYITQTYDTRSRLFESEVLSKDSTFIQKLMHAYDLGFTNTGNPLTHYLWLAERDPCSRV